MHRVGVLGSCVTRDALTPLSDNVQISWYQARTSIPSMGSQPAFVSLSFEDSSLPAFEQRNAFFDLYKSWRANIMRDDYEYLLIDFIDERFGCLLRGGAYKTWSTSYRAGKLHDEDGKTFPYISALSPLSIGR